MYILYTHKRQKTNKINVRQIFCLFVISTNKKCVNKPYINDYVPGLNGYSTKGIKKLLCYL